MRPMMQLEGLEIQQHQVWNYSETQNDTLNKLNWSGDHNIQQPTENEFRCELECHSGKGESYVEHFSFASSHTHSAFIFT